MVKTGYRLADHVLAEPLVCGFTAWWCNVAPLAGAMHAVRYVIPVLEAYVDDPEASYTSALNPALVGGPFVGVPPEHADEVADVLERITGAYADGAAATEAVLSFSEHLLGSANGQTLEPYYASCPDALKGLVELVYDYHNRPSIRFDEGLLYRSSLFTSQLQELRLSRHVADATRPFYVTTPHVPSRPGARIAAPLADDRLRRIFALDVEPMSRRIVADLVGGNEALEYFSEGPARVSPTWKEPRSRVRTFGHATVLVEHGGVSFLVDPVIPVVPLEGGAERMTYDDLPERLDFVAITHIHPDHFLLETLMRLGPRIGRLLVPRALGMVIGDVSMRRIVERVGLERVVEVDTFDGFREGDVEVVVTPFFGEHGDLAHGSKVTYVVRAGTDTFYFAADSACLEPKIPAELMKVFGSLQNVFMNTETEGAPISWPFDGLFPRKRARALEATRKCRGSNYDEGVKLLEIVRPKRLYNYAMGLEPWMSFLLGPASGPETSRMKEASRLMETARGMGVVATRLQGAAELMLE